jgi:3-hydroxyisobutyrate dehydrogenase-like beta-hydroxyacid dehydrogenase
MTGAPPIIAVLGLGEAGSAIASELCSAGAAVRGFDPRVPAAAGIVQCGSDAEACRDANIVIALTSAGEAEQTLREALPGTYRGVVYADLNTSSAGLKLMLADIAATAGLRFADVALMSAVPGNGLRTPMLACGQGAAEYADVFRRFGASVEVPPGPVGAAVTRKLVRSVFYKGLAAAVTEALRAGRAAGCQEWIRENILTRSRARRRGQSTGSSVAAKSTRAGAPMKWLRQASFWMSSACLPGSRVPARSG